MHWYELSRSQHNQNRTNRREQLVATAPTWRVLCQVKDHPGTRTDDLVSSGKHTQLQQQAVNPWASSHKAGGWLQELLRETHFTSSQNIKYKWPVHPTKQNICLLFFFLVSFNFEWLQNYIHNMFLNRNSFKWLSFSNIQNNYHSKCIRGFSSCLLEN